MTAAIPSTVRGGPEGVTPAPVRSPSIDKWTANRLATFLACAYGIAICFERLVEIEVFKPYRLIGGVLILGAVVAGHLVFERVARLALSYIFIGLLLGLLHVFNAGVPSQDLWTNALLWFYNVGTFVALISLLRTRRSIMVVALFHALGMCVAAYDMFVHAEELRSEGAVLRVSGDFKNPANACLSLLAAAILIIEVLFRRRREGRAPHAGLFLVAVAVIGFAVYVSSLTGSRSGAAAMMGGLAAYLVVSGRRRLAASVLVALVLILVVAAGDTGFFPESSESNILATRVRTKGFDTDRLYLWRAGFDAYLDSYGFGLGLAQYRTVHREYFAPYARFSDERWLDSRLSLHNDIVASLVEFGTLGLLVFLALCRTIWLTVRRIEDRSVRGIGTGLLVAAAINAMSHSVLPYFALWFYLALLAAWARIERRERALSEVSV